MLMERYLIRPGRRRHPLIHLPCLSFWMLLRTCWRSRRRFLLAVACFLYLFCFLCLFCFVSWRNKVDLLGHVDKNRLLLKDLPGSPSPTRSNVVYITLRAKRHKPAVLRATLRPKSRRRKMRKVQNQSQDQHIDTPGRTRSRDTWRQIIHNGQSFTKSEVSYDSSSIRIYSKKPPPWFSQADIDHMRLLSKCEITHVKAIDGHPGLLFKSLDRFNQNSDFPGGCHGLSGIIKTPEEMSEVFAFHLDRILGLNRSLPTISRRLHALDGQLCPVALYDPSVTPVPEIGSGSLTWSSYQTSLKNKCWQLGIPKPEWGCTSIHHYEWSKLAMFDFLLQIHQRLDRNCCGFRPRLQDSCVQLGYHRECSSADNTELSHITHRKNNPRHLVFLNNQGFFDRDEENLDFKLLEGIKEFPDDAVSVLSSQRLREKLLQSLFLDEYYWKSQGGRQGIEKLIDVIERRAKVLLRYINAHGISVVPMNT